MVLEKKFGGPCYLEERKGRYGLNGHCLISNPLLVAEVRNFDKVNCMT